MSPHIFVIFGASGDLTARKLIPAFYHLHEGGYLPEQFALLGVSRSKLSDEDFRKRVVFDSPFLPEGISDADKKKFASALYYQPIDTAEEAEYAKVKDRLLALDQEKGTPGNYIFYMSTPPKLYKTIPAYLSTHGLNTSNGHFRRLVIEKPFGYDLASGQQLNEVLIFFL